MSLENYDNETKRAAKTAVFRERTIHRQKPIESVNSAKEALIVSLNEKGRVDLPHMARLLNRPPEEFLPELGGVLFLNPQLTQSVLKHLHKIQQHHILEYFHEFLFHQLLIQAFLIFASGILLSFPMLLFL